MITAQFTCHYILRMLIVMAAMYYDNNMNNKIGRIERWQLRFKALFQGGIGRDKLFAKINNYV